MGHFKEGRYLCRGFLIFQLAAIIFIMSASVIKIARAAAVVPSGYALNTVVSQLNFPTNLAWLPDGTMLVSEKAGIVKAVRNGTATVLADISATTNDYWDHGMIGIAVDPAYASNHYIYLTRTYENNGADYAGTKTGQLVRITTNTDSTQMVAGSLLVLLGKSTPASCSSLPATADCMPADSPSHSVGDVVFASDGALFVSNGDGAAFTYNDVNSLRAQNLDSLSGKLLRIDKNGLGLAGNPFYNGTAGANRSKVYAYGLRNPWRLSFKTGTVVPYVVDVGSDQFEEVNVAMAGANFGWPCYEGYAQHDLAEFHAGCAALYAAVAQNPASVKMPLVAWSHNSDGGAGVGGAWVTGASYPASLQGSYMFGDYVHLFLRTLRTDTSHALSAGPSDFASNVLGEVNIEQGPDGKVYIVTIADASNNPDTGSIVRLDYQAAPTDCAEGQFKAEYFAGPVLAGTPLLQRCEAAPLAYDWGAGGPGAPLGVDNFSVRWSGTFNFAAGNYAFDAWADDGVRLLLDGATLLNGWQDQQYTHYQSHTGVAAGKHRVAIEYYEAGGDAAVKAGWTRESAPPTACAAGQFQADYYNGAAAAGTPVLSACEAAPLNHLWALGSPGAGINADHFAAHWSGAFDFAAGSYAFDAWADDGVRVALDGVLLIDGWKDQEYTHYQHIAEVTAGSHAVAVDYYEASGEASVNVGWTPQFVPPGGCAASQFRAEYFNNITLAGTAARIACETPPLQHDWALGSPGSGVNVDNFSARWSGSFPFVAGTHLFQVGADDGVRLLVDGVKLIDGWKDQARTAYQASKYLTAGQHAVVVEYYDSGMDAVLNASWQLGAANVAPTASIAAPADNASVAIGAVVNFSGGASDPEDGAIPAARLQWSVVIQHCATTGTCHSHFLTQSTGASGSFTYPDHGADPYYVELSLIATDSGGLQSTKKIRLDPRR